MRRFTGVLVMSLLLLQFPPASLADEDSKKAEIAKLMEIVQPVQHAERLRQTMLKKNQGQSIQSNPMLMKLIDMEAQATNMTPEQKAALIQKRQAEQNAKMQRLAEIITEESKGLDDYFGRVIPQLYDKYYTDGDIHNLLAFFQSPTGRKYVTTQNQMSDELQQLSSKMADDTVKRSLERFMAESGIPSQTRAMPPAKGGGK